MNYLEVNNYFSEKFNNHVEYVNDHEVYSFIIASCIN
jgi:hypothetical protein